MIKLLRHLTLILLAPAPLAAQQSPFTIEQVMGAPFPDELTAAPTGDHVALLRRGQVWWASLADTLPAEQLIHARGTARSLRWSPDGSKLAFVSDRGDHAFVAVYDVATKTLRFLDPSVDSDADPV